MRRECGDEPRALDAYIEAWEVHPHACGPDGGGELERLLGGTLSDDGLVTSHRDYWDMASLLAQLGVMAAPNFSA